MLHRAAQTVAAVFVILCLLAPTAIIAPSFLRRPVQYIVRNANGSSTGFYLSQHHLVIRRHGYGPALDTEDWTYVPYALACLALPPVLWFATHRPSHDSRPASRRFAYVCAACPAALTIAVLYLRRDDGSLMLFAIAWFLASVIYTVARLDKRPSRAQRRLQNGLCPRCAYDLRATPDHCPECGYQV